MNAYVTGYTASTDFPVTSAAIQSNYGGGPYDAFVTDLNASGSSLVYATYVGGSGDDGSGIAVDSLGNVYVAGYADSSNYPTTASAMQLANKGAEEEHTDLADRCSRSGGGKTVGAMSRSDRFLRSIANRQLLCVSSPESPRFNGHLSPRAICDVALLKMRN